MRITTYNVEWFSNLFDDTGNLLHTDDWSGRYNIKKSDQLDAIGHVFNGLDADAVMVVEAPDSHAERDGKKALENFAAHYGLRTTKAVDGFFNTTQQEITLLFDPNKFSATHDPIGQIAGENGSRDAPRFDTAFRLDLDIDAKPDVVRFSKPPLEVALKTNSGFALRMIGVHAKSKAPHGAKNKAEAIRISIQNRRKQLAQCIWLRQRVDHHLKNGDPLIVLGDFNDGPGLDEYEKLFGKSGIEIVLGEGDQTPLFDPHAKMALERRIGAIPTTARFFLRHEKRYLQALLDYIMVSPDLMVLNPDWHIWHPFDDPVCYDVTDMRDALLIASDHFPVTVDLDI